jgi:nitroreductase
MIMDIYEAIYSRRTVRDFEKKEIDLVIVKRILDAGLRAPSNNHMRQWEFVIISDKSVRLRVIEKVKKNVTEKEIERILDSWECLDQCQREMYFDAIPKQYRMLLSAGCLIIPCFLQKSPLLKPSSLSALNGFASIWCCIENMLIAAAAEGIYGVTRIPFDEELKHIKAVLSIPQDYEIPCYVALGYPDKNAEQVRQQSIDVDRKMHFNKWQ